MSDELRESLRVMWPSFSKTPAQSLDLALRADEIYRVYSADNQNPHDLFEKATRYHGSLRRLTRTNEQDQGLEKQVHDMIIHAIFSSNCIERVGMELDITFHLCRKILSGETIPELDERAPEYKKMLLDLYKLDPALKDMPANHLLLGCREVIQHMNAFQHIIRHFVIQREDMTEDLIRETHKILCDGIPIIQDDIPEVPSQDYAGKYRSVPVGAGGTMFVVPRFVPQKMQEMCQEMKRELETAESKGSIDPISLASKYSLQFVAIHPFQDGNGRLCRMILNIILFRYTGVIVSIGEREEDRAEYMGIKIRSKEMDDHGEYATFVLGKCTRTLHKIKQKLHGEKK